MYNIINCFKCKSCKQLFLFAKNRGASHRVAAYQLFQKQGYHTLTLDPRGYGDSTISSEINETSVVKDAVMAMR